MDPSGSNYIATWIMVFGILGIVGLFLVLWIIVTRNKDAGRTEREWRAVHQTLDRSREEREHRETPAPVRPDESTCPNCGGHILATESVCRICGHVGRPTPTQGARYAVVRQDIPVSGRMAFTERELVTIEGVSPDPARPEYRFIVHSKSLKKRFRLREEDLIF